MFFMTLHIDWFTSDLHLGHVNMRKWRALEDRYATMDEFNDEVIRRFNDNVGPDDTVMILGDVCMGKMADTLPLVERLNGRKLLIPGNHDRNWLGNRKRVTEVHDWPAKYEAVGLEPMLPGIYDIDGLGEVKMDHFPYRNKPNGRDTERHFDEALWQPDDDGHWLLHGHVHHEWTQWGRMINVGMDAWGGYPVSTEVLAAVMAEETDRDAHDSWFPGLTRPTSV